MRGERLPDIGHTVRRTLVMRCVAAMHLARVFKRELEVERALAESSLETSQVHIDLIATARLRRIVSTSMALALGQPAVDGEDPRVPNTAVTVPTIAHNVGNDTESRAASPPPPEWPGTERLPSTSNHENQSHELVSVGH